MCIRDRRFRGYEVETLENDEFGRVTLQELERKMRPNTALISVMHVNNETGAVNPVDDLAALAKRINPRCFFHSDGVQAFLKVNSPNLTRIDAYSISGHKFHAPRGVGVLYIRRGVPMHRLILGGSQEHKMRPGTENLPGILGLTAALKRYQEHKEEYRENMWSVKRRLYQNLAQIPGIHLNGPQIDEGAPHILSVGFSGAPAETLLNALSDRGIYCGTGSACSSHSPNRSRVLTAMGVPEEYKRGTLRFSFCYENTVKEADDTAQVIDETLIRLRRFKRR